MKNRVVRLQKQLDDEVVKRDKVEIESQMLERRVVEMHDRASAGKSLPPPQQSVVASKKVRKAGIASEAIEDSLNDATKS